MNVRAAKVRIYPDKDRRDRVGDRDCSTSELTGTVSQCVSVLHRQETRTEIAISVPKTVAREGLGRDKYVLLSSC